MNSSIQAFADDFTLGSAASVKAVSFEAQITSDFTDGLTIAFYSTQAQFESRSPIFSQSYTQAELLLIPDFDVVHDWQVQLNLSAPLALLAGTYLFEVHGGQVLNADDTHQIVWIEANVNNGTIPFKTDSVGCGPSPCATTNAADFTFTLYDSVFVPEPATLGFTGAGLALLGVLARRRV